jgi:hypothetical protein
MADLSNTAVDLIAQSTLDPLLAPDMPDLSSLTLMELDVLSGFHRAIASAALAFANQPRCTGKVEQIIDESETRAWHFVRAIADEAASRNPENTGERLLRARMIIGNAYETEDLEGVILTLADEIRAGKPPSLA